MLKWNLQKTVGVSDKGDYTDVASTQQQAKEGGNERQKTKNGEFHKIFILKIVLWRHANYCSEIRISLLLLVQCRAQQEI